MEFLQCVCVCVPQRAWLWIQPHHLQHHIRHMEDQPPSSNNSAAKEGFFCVFLYLTAFFTQTTYWGFAHDRQPQPCLCQLCNVYHRSLAKHSPLVSICKDSRRRYLGCQKMRSGRAGGRCMLEGVKAVTKIKHRSAYFCSRNENTSHHTKPVTLLLPNTKRKWVNYEVSRSECTKMN